MPGILVPLPDWGQSARVFRPPYLRHACAKILDYATGKDQDPDMEAQWGRKILACVNYGQYLAGALRRDDDVLASRLYGQMAVVRKDLITPIPKTKRKFPFPEWFGDVHYHENHIRWLVWKSKPYREVFPNVEVPSKEPKLRWS